jgi:acetate kinase
MLLVVNAGSSSLKLALFDQDLAEQAQARSERIGGGGPPDHAAALAQGMAEMGLSPRELTAAAHRVVHGGAHLTQACRVTPQVHEAIRACILLAPLHNPANLSGIEAIANLAPNLPQYASFDTAFHATNPALATTYALPMAERARGLRRYGFHGLSFAGMVRKVKEISENFPQRRLLGLHLGNGASLCAMVDGISVATTMGYSPLDGLVMGTRAGGLDPGVVLDLAARHGVEGAARILNREAGLLALGGSNDMRSLHGAADFAVDHFIYWAIRHAGSMVAAMGGLDAIAFTGGIGENDEKVRAGILLGLGFLGLVPEAGAKGTVVSARESRVIALVIKAEEERQIAIEAAANGAFGGRE